jgi:cytochrome c
MSLRPRVIALVCVTVESLEESLVGGIIAGHPAMPEFRFDPEQVGDVIAYLKSLVR